MQTKSVLSVSDVLIRGSDLLKALPHFKLVGRDQELKELSTILMMMKKRNLVITGRGGVGISAIVLGIQESKKLHHTPVEIVGKRFFWLMTDKLFESGDAKVINSLFEKVRQTLSATSDSVVIIEDSADFIKAAHQSGCSNMINGLTGDLKSGRYQGIFESSDESLGELLKCDGDLREFCTLYEVKEPSTENLSLILEESKTQLEKHHGIRLDASALSAAAQLTEKYKLQELRAQPDAAISLLDHAMTDYCRNAQAQPEELRNLQHELLSLKTRLLASKPAEQPALASQIQSAQTKLEQAQTKWSLRQEEIRSLSRDLSDGEEEIRKLEDQIDSLRSQHQARADTLQQSNNGASMQSQDSARTSTLSLMLSAGNLDTDEVSSLKSRISKLEALVNASRVTYKKRVAEVYASLCVTEAQVLKTFSTLSGIPVDKLSEDERVKLKNLPELLAKRVIGQEEPTHELAQSVKRSRLGLKLPNKPSGTFMFLGPSGVGKTELAKALSEALEVPLLRFDMSEYMEKHAVAKLIGAPPGYEGYEHGGVLTNAVRRNPYSVVLFDEIEKAHVDVFNVMLQLLDDARLTDSRGLTASFKDAIIIMTTNIGTTHFLDESFSFEQSKEKALADLRQQYKPEFLGRFSGNIYCFKRLSTATLETIAKKDIARIGRLIQSKNLTLQMDEAHLRGMVETTYVVREGARSILGYIDRNITAALADILLEGSPTQGAVQVTFDTNSRTVKLKMSGDIFPLKEAAVA